MTEFLLGVIIGGLLLTPLVGGGLKYLVIVSLERRTLKAHQRIQDNEEKIVNEMYQELTSQLPRTASSTKTELNLARTTHQPES